ncbi:sensor histidine kinase [Streptomyces sp. SP18BB07]|uniref:sensor histidine kinase n=1 Tax=Streptomyces sp. SP18BB07 TaxID=3002522 RepID=UPI002E77CC53|nr:histidine kinase [Streptomyces sp. SP18BB07]MEE1766177.1 histidine kinase [Streptomyces sp. SP18BB07]
MTGNTSTDRAEATGVGAVWPALVERLRTAGGSTALRYDAYLAAALAVFDCVTATAVTGDGRVPDPPGFALLLAVHVPLVWRRRRPVLALWALVAVVAPYHALDYNHPAAVAPAMLALYTVAVSGTARRTLLNGAAVVALTLAVNALFTPHQIPEFLRISGWIVSVLVFGGYVRVHRQYVDSVVERAERAERTREEEARRRVAEERLRIARDLHDLLAHSITLVGVQTSVAAHVLAADPDRLDRAAVAKALDDIAETCRTARGELRGTLEVLRESEFAHTGVGARGPLPGLDGLSDLVGAARSAGARVEVTVTADGVPPGVGAAAYRIVQEALTNAVRHGGENLVIRVEARAGGGALRVRVTDDGVGGRGAVGRPGVGAGSGGSGPGFGGGGFGILGMRERARSVGGTVEAGPRADGGFEVEAVLPLGGAGARHAAAGDALEPGAPSVPDAPGVPGASGTSPERKAAR